MIHKDRRDIQKQHVTVQIAEMYTLLKLKFDSITTHKRENFTD